jgi:hypothetical protein
LFRNIRLEKTSQTAMVTGSELNKWVNLKNARHDASRLSRTKKGISERGN